jgi:hypothetical protein
MNEDVSAVNRTRPSSTRVISMKAGGSLCHWVNEEPPRMGRLRRSIPPRGDENSSWSAGEEQEPSMPRYAYLYETCKSDIVFRHSTNILSA